MYPRMEMAMFGKLALKESAPILMEVDLRVKISPRRAGSGKGEGWNLGRGVWSNSRRESRLKAV